MIPPITRPEPSPPMLDQTSPIRIVVIIPQLFNYYLSHPTVMITTPPLPHCDCQTQLFPTINGGPHDRPTNSKITITSVVNAKALSQVRRSFSGWIMTDSMDKIAVRNRVACIKSIPFIIIEPEFFDGERRQMHFGTHGFLKKQTHFQNITCLPDNSIAQNGFFGLKWLWKQIRR